MGKKKIKTIESNADYDTEQKAKTGEAKPEGKRKKIRKYVPQGQAHIYATYNNTIISLTDLHGNVIAQGSAGRLGFRGAKKSTPYAASKVAQSACEKSQIYGLEKVDVFLNGIGSGRESAVRALAANGLTILSIQDVTPIPHNGCRPRKARRV
ncbi:MAG: 30S ribosomal protein S11 [Patescibacteria group bacterium]|nr:30S ribosomal protein S11 [Patescibacteria group bacterium]